jgi:integrase/recombinase XerD
MQLGAPSSLAAELECYCFWLTVRNYSTLTIRDRRTAITALLRWLEVQTIDSAQSVTPAVLESYREHLFKWRQVGGAPLANSTQIARLVPIRAFFKWLARELRAPQNAAADLELPRSERRLPKAILSPDEIESILSVANIATLQGLRDRAILETLSATAVRRLELVNLRVEDVDAARCLLFVRKGKGRRDRLVPLGERALSWIQAYQSTVRPIFLRGQETRALFLSARGLPLSPKRLSARVTAYIRTGAPLKAGSCHLFRHSIATLMHENGADIRFVQAFLGHESLSSTQIYTHVAVAKLAAVHAATHPSTWAPPHRKMRRASKPRLSRAPCPIA